MSQLHFQPSPLRVAIVGSGPSAFYVAEHLLKRPNLVVEIDMFERLLTPYGLVRGGVAPDHEKIKSVTKVYASIASAPNFRFFGNVEVGKDITHADLIDHYHQIVYAVGAQSDRRMGIPGEDLSGSHAATEFVGWYNAHPDYRDLKFDLSQKRVAVIGNGNVAMDVARILAKTYAEIECTDMADYALAALAESQVQEIYILGRRGPIQAAFTNPELKELGELAGADVIVPPDELTLDPLSQAEVAAKSNPSAEKNLKTLHEFAQRASSGKPRKLILRFLVSPVELIGGDHVEAIRLVKNELHKSADGSLRPHPTGAFETLPVGLVFRSIGYMGMKLPDVPFDEKATVIPNRNGQVIDPATEQPIPGEFVVGWIKRGPNGVIGTNKPDAQETAQSMIEAAPGVRSLDPEKACRESIEQLLRVRKPDYVTFDDWRIIDRLEIEMGQAVGRPRRKFSRPDDMLSALLRTKRLENLHPV